jgi:hypothetical protein
MDKENSRVDLRQADEPERVHFDGPDLGLLAVTQGSEYVPSLSFVLDLEENA